jgi:integrase
MAARKRLPGLNRIEKVFLEYEKYLLAKGNKAKSYTETMRRMYRWHPDSHQAVADVTQQQLTKFYQKRQKQVSTDSHRNELAEVKTFWRWCMKKCYVASSPAENIEPVGRRRKGKAQLRRSEAAQFFSIALELAESGDEGAVAVLAVLMLGLRSAEIRERKVRDVDVGSENVLLWIEDGKTHAATRHLELPNPLDELLVRQAEGKEKGDWLFPSSASSGHRGSTWLLKNVRRICEAAGVPTVCAHGLRGTWATLATDAGVSAHVIARELGHTNPEVTRQHYTKAGATDRAMSRKMLKVVKGGRK